MNGEEEKKTSEKIFALLTHFFVVVENLRIGVVENVFIDVNVQFRSHNGWIRDGSQLFSSFLNIIENGSANFLLWYIESAKRQTMSWTIDASVRFSEKTEYLDTKSQ